MKQIILFAFFICQICSCIFANDFGLQKLFEVNQKEKIYSYYCSSDGKYAAIDIVGVNGFVVKIFDFENKKKAELLHTNVIKCIAFDKYHNLYILFESGELSIYSMNDSFKIELRKERTEYLNDIFKKKCQWVEKDCDGFALFFCELGVYKSITEDLATFRLFPSVHPLRIAHLIRLFVDDNEKYQLVYLDDNSYFSVISLGDGGIVFFQGTMGALDLCKLDNKFYAILPDKVSSFDKLDFKNVQMLIHSKPIICNEGNIFSRFSVTNKYIGIGSCQLKGNESDWSFSLFENATFKKIFSETMRNPIISIKSDAKDNIYIVSTEAVYLVKTPVKEDLH